MKGGNCALIQTMKTVLFCLVMGMAARPAWAGYCDEDGAKATVGELEAYAKKKGKEEPSLDGICMEAVQELPKLKKRTIAACTKVIEREPQFAPCVAWSVKFGAKQLGTVELFDKVGELFKIDAFPYGLPTLELYDALGDARAVPLVLEAWKAALLDKRAKQDRYRYEFTVWRHAAIKIFSKLGGASERAFLEEQAAAIKDRGLLKAIKKANAAIDQRAAGTTAAPAKP
jgi:hypothetical protein